MAVQSIDPSTATIVGGVGMILLLLLAWFVRYITEPVVYIEPVESLVTAAEQRFYEALDEAVDGRLMILSKVRVADLLSVTSENRSARYRIFRSIASKHVDFVLVEARDLRPLAAIELDDSTHRRRDRRKRDELLDDLFAKAKLPLLRFKTASTYNRRSIEARFEEALGETWKA
jgi:very-short-patch-repair endonuclease